MIEELHHLESKCTNTPDYDPLPAPVEELPFDSEKAYLMSEYLWTVPVFYDDREAIDHLINRFNCNIREARYAVRLGPDTNL